MRSVLWELARLSVTKTSNYLTFNVFNCTVLCLSGFIKVLVQIDFNVGIAVVESLGSK